MTTTQLPTLQSGSFAMAAFRDSLTAVMNTDSGGTKLTLCYYAVTELGWWGLRDCILGWVSRQTGRQVVAYVGTDHAITDPQALVRMRSDGVDVWLMVRYRGIYHPKVAWLSAPRRHLVWVGSNNLTREGLQNNIECATLVESAEPHPDFLRWIQEIHSAAAPLDDQLLNNYRGERDRYGAARVGVGTFTWSGKEEPAVSPAPVPAQQPVPAGPLPQPSVARPGDLLVEVMPRETGLEGKQVQLPMAGGVQFFGLANQIGATRHIQLSYQGGLNQRSLTMTIFRNRTVRLSLNELDYRDRPCVLVFERTGTNRFEYEIVQRSIAPTRYRNILQACQNQTRHGSRRWGIA